MFYKYDLTPICMVEPNRFLLQALDLPSQLRGVIERTGSKSRSIPFSNPTTAAWALIYIHLETTQIRKHIFTRGFPRPFLVKMIIKIIVKPQ